MEGLTLDGLYRGAEHALLVRRWETAEALAREGIRRDPHDGTGHYLLGRALANSGRLRAALAVAEEAREHAPDDLRLQWLVGACLLDLKRFEDAAEQIAYLTDAAAHLPSTWELSTRLHLARRHAGRAEEAARQWLGVQPDVPRAHGMLGLALLLQRRVAEAEEEARDGLRLDPEDAFSLEAALECALARRRYQEARGLARALIRVAPTSSAVERTYARCSGLAGPLRPLAWWLFVVGRWPLMRRVAVVSATLTAIVLLDLHAGTPWTGPVRAFLGGLALCVALAARLFRLAVRRRWFL